jgi:hypothetical protein
MPRNGEGKAGEAAAGRKGGRALLGAAMAIVGALAAVHPTNGVLVALSEAVPQLAAALPPVITACGAVLAAMSEPPRVGRVR